MDRMRIKKTLLLVLFFIFAPLVSCNLSDETVNFHFVNLQIVGAELPESFTLNETYEIKVTFVRPNNCIFFEGFEISKGGSTERNVVAIGSELDDTACEHIAEEAVEYFDFTCYYTDSYVFRFWTGEDANGVAQYLEYEVPVSPSSKY